MNRVNKLLNFDYQDRTTKNLMYAFCFCLSPQEACELFKAVPRENKILLEKTLRKICSDIESNFLPCHGELILSLEKELASVKSTHRQSIGYYLTSLSDPAPSEVRKKTQEIFLTSKYIGVRKRGYKSIIKNQDTDHEALLKCWKTYNDTECAWTITNTFPAELIIPIRKDLILTFSEGWQYSRIYKKIGVVRPELINELKTIDEISFCYVLAKLDKKLTSKDAKQIIDNNIDDERLGLLIWALGQLGLWDSLLRIESKLFKTN